MTWESMVDIPYNIRLTVDIPVVARSRESAIEKAGEFVHAGEIVAAAARRNWKDIAGELLDEGMSQSEVALAVGANRANVAREFPGRGWSKTESVRFREMKRQLDEIGDFL